MKTNECHICENDFDNLGLICLQVISLNETNTEENLLEKDSTYEAEDDEH